MTDSHSAPSSDDDRPPHLADEVRALAAELSDAAGLLLCTDFDGTLADITDRPDDPEIRPRNRESLRTLRDSPNVSVAVVSGREVEDLRTRVGVEGVAYAGNHGLEIHRGGETVVHPIAAKRRSTVAAICDELDARLGGIDGCLVENKGITATVHHRLAPDEETETIRETVRAVVDEFGGPRFRVSLGKSVVEFSPAIPWHKGRAVELLADEHPHDWLPVYLGDDTTDEFAFAAVGQHGLGVHVGEGHDTVATHRVADPDAVESLLTWLAETGANLVGNQRPVPDEVSVFA